VVEETLETEIAEEVRAGAGEWQEKSEAID
jgi:hypothetical protein